MSKRTYRWQGKSWGIPADVAAAELERIRKEQGLTAEAIVAEAEPDSSPLHPAFQWDDVEAGHEYRLIQARRLARSVSVIVGKAEPRSLYVNVKMLGREGTYEPMELVIQHPDQFAFALAALERKLDSAAEAVEELRALAAAGSDPDKTARIAVAVEAFRAAQEAVRSLH